MLNFEVDIFVNVNKSFNVFAFVADTIRTIFGKIIIAFYCICGSETKILN